MTRGNHENRDPKGGGKHTGQSTQKGSAKHTPDTGNYGGKHKK